MQFNKTQLILLIGHIGLHLVLVRVMTVISQI